MWNRLAFRVNGGLEERNRNISSASVGDRTFRFGVILDSTTSMLLLRTGGSQLNRPGCRISQQIVVIISPLTFYLFALSITRRASPDRCCQVDAADRPEPVLLSGCAPREPLTQRPTAARSFLSAASPIPFPKSPQGCSRPSPALLALSTTVLGTAVRCRPAHLLSFRLQRIPDRHPCLCFSIRD